MISKRMRSFLLYVVANRFFQISDLMEAMQCDRRTVYRVRDNLSEEFDMEFKLLEGRGWTVTNWGWFNNRVIFRVSLARIDTHKSKP